MSKEVVAAIISAAAAVIAASLPLYFQNRRLRRETKLIATGLAVAYYYNFITKLFDLINDPTSELIITERGAKQLPPRLRGAKLRIYFPPDLDEGSLKDTSVAIRSDSRIGEIRRGNEKPMQVNFTMKPRGDDTDVLIVADFPTILDAASKHYSGMARTTDFSKSEVWKTTSEQELKEFRAKIRKMVEETRLKDRVELVQG